MLRSFMDTALVTGSGGLVGSQAVIFLAQNGFQVLGLDNNFRKIFFGPEADTKWLQDSLKKDLPAYRHFNLDIRNQAGIEKIFKKYGRSIKIIIHAAAQPSHDWAAQNPAVDFSINATATLILLEAVRKYCPEAVFIFVSTNKVYGDRVNELPLVELEKRWELDHSSQFYQGIDENFGLDQTKHSLFGVSKTAADLMTQEYGRYFGIKTGIFRCGCITGPNHSAARLHGFLGYLMKCALTGEKYTIFGYQGKQVRDNIHSYDLVNMFWHFFKKPRPGEVYNAGGSRVSNCSVLEAIELCEKITGKKLNFEYSEKNRIGDHIWYISNIQKFKSHYPDWQISFGLGEILTQINQQLLRRSIN